MSTGFEESYRRLLAWYPKRWRELNGDVMIGILLDTAESEGRTRPTVGEALSIATHGVAERLNRDFALVVAAVATALAILTGILSILFLSEFTRIELAWVLQCLQLFVVPSLVGLALSGFLRDVGVIGPRRAVVASTLCGLASGALLILSLLWSSAFRSAASETASTVSWAGLVILLASSWALGSVAIAIGIDGLLRRTALERFARGVLATGAGLMLAPALAVSLLSPVVGAISSLVVLVGLMRLQPSRRKGPIFFPSERAAISSPTALRAALLWAGVALGLLSVAFVAAGAQWLRGFDSTQAMQLGIAGGLVAGLPIVTSVALTIVGNPTGRVSSIVLVSALIALSLAIAAVCSLPAFPADSAVRWYGLLVAVLAAAAGVGVFAFTVSRGTRMTRIWLAVAVGSGYAVTMGIVMTYAAAFAAPIVGTVLAVRLIRIRPMQVGAAA